SAVCVGDGGGVPGGLGAGAVAGCCDGYGPSAQAGPGGPAQVWRPAPLGLWSDLCGRRGGALAGAPAVLAVLPGAGDLRRTEGVAADCGGGAAADSGRDRGLGA